MTSETPSKPTKLCPTCGTRVGEDATRCLVCGGDLTSGEKPSRPAKAIQGSQMPQITLTLPFALGLLALFLSIGAGLVFFGLRQSGRVVEPTPTPTVTLTLTPTTTPTPQTPTPTHTPLPTPTPISYQVAANDTCLGIASAFDVSVLSIVQLNNLPADCSTLSIGQTLQIPQPTPTPTSPPTATLSSAESTEQACEKADYVVQEGDTLSTIASAYNVPQAAIKEQNGLSSDIVFSGMPLVIPLCDQVPTGPTHTPTPPPPYAAPNLLLPTNGATLTEDTVTLQWASVGTLRENEQYAVTVIDLTEGEERKIIEYVTENKFIVPIDFRAAGAAPHIYGWSVMAVRQTGSDDDGNPIWETAGAASSQRVFSWSGGSGPAPAPEATATP
jgi:LysM repeat protein